MKNFTLCTSWSKCMTYISLRSDFWLSKICDASMPQMPLVVGWKRRQKYQMLWWGFIHIERSRESFEKLTFIFTKLTKPPNRWLIKEWMISDFVIIVPPCNRPRTSKSYTPHRDQGKGWIKMLTYLNYGRILCYRYGTYEIYSIS
jgi:hypothetical protein